MSINYETGSIGGSSTPGVKYTYLGFSQTKTNNSLNTQQTYQSTKQRLQWMRDHESTWQINYIHPSYGRLESVNIEQKDTFWNAVLNYTNPLNNGIIITTPDDKDQPYNTNLDITMLSLPLEKHPNYVYNWNHLLISLHPYVYFPSLAISDPTKISKDLAMAMVNASSGTLRWVKDQSQIPVQKEMVQAVDSQGNPTDEMIAAPWVIASIATTPGATNPENFVQVNRLKPGVEYYEIPTYEITEWGQYSNPCQCRWALIEGGQLAYPRLGDYGIQNYYHPELLTGTITAGYWLCEGGNITFDGKYYNATCKYLWSPQPSGWDLDLYDFFSGFAYYKQQSQTNPNPIVGTNETGSIFNPRNTRNNNITNPIIPDNNGGN